jgi:hypothetical protein
VAIPVDPTTLFLYWEVRGRTLEHLRASRPGGGIALRLLIITPTWDGPRSEVRDIPVDRELGDWFVRDLPAGAVVRAAIGWRLADTFVPVAHSPALETPPDAPSPLVADALVRWTSSGVSRVDPADPDAGGIERALRRVRGYERGGVARGVNGAHAMGSGRSPLGSSDQRASAGA